MKKIFFLGLVATLLFGSCQNNNKNEEKSVTMLPPPPKEDSLTKDTIVPPPPAKENDRASTVEDNTVYDFVGMKNPPKYPGGLNEFYKYLVQNIKYPAVALAKNIEGTVFLSFLVEKDGSITAIKVDRKLGSGTDEEAVRILKASKKWIPGMQDGKPVRVKYNMPIKFTLSK